MVEKHKKDQELLRLRELKSRIDRGLPIEDLPPESSVGTQKALRETEIRLAMPKASNLTRYKGTSKQQWREWYADNESYHTPIWNDPAKIQLGHQNCSFNQKDRWTRYVETKRREDGEYEPTWEEMKQFMLEALGGLEQRQKDARLKLKHISQNGRDPTTLLTLMEAEWEELDYPEQEKVHQLYAALDLKVRDRVDLKANFPKTVSELENLAKDAHRWVTETEPTGSKRKRSKGDDKEYKGSKRNKFKKFKGEKPERADDKPDRDNKFKKKDPWCHTCKNHDHWTRKCPKNADNDNVVGAVTFEDGRNRLLIDVNLKGPKGSEEVPGLFDTGCENTLLSQRIADAMGLAIEPTPSMTAKSINGQIVPILGKCTLAIGVKDSYESLRTGEVQFWVA
ncbi:hypothetical protein P152DRAFT_347768, partial [Eremomyces bilateralis CBS 781.70]